MNLTEHFTDEELAVAGCDGRLIGNALYLCATLLEPLRERFGPVAVHDGYRDPSHNARVGGKPASFHLFVGAKSAADVSAVNASVNEMFDWVRLESHLPFDEVILERNRAGIAVCLHLQIDSSDVPRRWALVGNTGDATEYERVPVN